MTSSAKRALLGASAAAIAAVGFMVGRAWAGGIPATGALAYSGTLESADGMLLTGDHPIEINFWNTSTPATTPLCETGSGKTYPVEGGHFSVQLPDACSDAVKGNADVWVEVVVDGVSLGTTKLGAVPYAVEANHAITADNAGGALLSQIEKLQSDVDALKKPFRTTYGYEQATHTITSTSWTWVKGSPPIDISAGEKVFVWNTAQIWAANSHSGAAGCAGCSSGTAKLVACYRSSDGTIVTSGAVAILNPDSTSIGRMGGANDYFTFPSGQDAVELGLCAARGNASATEYDFNLGYAYALVMRK